MAKNNIDYARINELKTERNSLIQGFKNHELKSSEVAHRVAEIDRQISRLERGKKDKGKG